MASTASQNPGNPTATRRSRVASPPPVAKDASAKTVVDEKSAPQKNELGPFVVWASQLNQVVASYYLFNALIVSGRKDVESIMRNTLLQSQTCSIVAEVLWSALHPKSVSASCGIACALMFTTLQAANLMLAFMADESTYTSGLAFALQCTAGLFMVPVAQIGHNFTLEQKVSPARYRSMAIWCASSLALAVLLTPSMASPLVAVPAGVLPMLVITVWLALSRRGCGDEQPSASKDSRSSENKKPATYVGVTPALAFVSLGCAIGTVGEAITDMAVTLALRKHLKGGRGDLAIANQTAVILSMLLAYWTEARSGSGGANKPGTFILAWSACQVFRSCCMDYLQTGGIDVFMFFALVCFGRYVGPLGKAAQDTALLKLLDRNKFVKGDKALKWSSVPCTLLWTMRMAVFRLERPLCQLILLHAAGLPVPWISGAFTGIACIGVLMIVKRPESTSQSTKKEQ